MQKVGGVVDELKFWEIVDSAHGRAGGDMDSKSELIKDAISKLSGLEANAFASNFDLKMNEAYSWPLWGAAYVINGGCSDDAFTDFRASLISRGRASFEQAIADPDSLADDDFDEEAWFYEGYRYAVADGVKAAGGSVPMRTNPHPDEPTGQGWDEEKVYGLYPKLAAKFA
jgi:hypothetical protein